jgi:photosystem II stability/assembly factor-like uncharacterized protein
MRRAALAALLASPALGQTWQELGPAPLTAFGGATGRVSALAAHPTNPGRLLVGGADGGVWRTDDGGASWTPVTDGLPTTAIGALALDPSNPDTVYAGSGEANFANHSRYGLGLYKSTDGGSSWRVLAEGTFAGRCFSTIRIHPARPRTLFAAVTTAGGFPALAAAKGHPMSLDPRGLYRSDDAGETWSLVGGGLPAEDMTDIAIDPADPNVMYAAVGAIFGSADNGVFRTADGGGTWSRVTLPRGGLGRIGLAATAGRVLAVLTRATLPDGSSGNTMGVFRSTNGGSTWSGPADVGSAPYGWYFARLAPHPTTPDLLYAGELSLSRSTNGGQGFGAIGPPHPDVHAIAWDAAGRLVVGCDGGVYRSANGQGSDWVSLNAGLGTAQFYAGLSTHPTRDDVLVGGLQDNGCVMLTGAGIVWRQLTGGDGGWTQISPHNPSIILTESQGTGNLYRSTNGGTSFGQVGAGLSGRNCFLPPYLFDPQRPGRVLYATERLWVSTDNAGSFTPLSADLTGGGIATIRAFAIAPSDPSHVYAATNDGRVLSSADGGATFTLRITDNPGWPRVTRELAVLPYDPRTVYLAGAVFGQPHVRRSTDAGATWETLDGDLPDTPINVIAVDPRGGTPVLFAGGDGGVWRSVDGGASWRPFGEGLPHANVVDLIVEPARGRVVAGTQGRGAWLIPLPCPTDFNGDGFTDFFDYSDFVGAFERGHPGADVNADGFLDAFDYARYVTDFESGC